MKEVCQTMENFKSMADKMDVVLFGAGEYCMRFLNRIGESIEKIRWIADNDSGKIGESLYGIPIFAPEKLGEMDKEKTLVVVTVGNHIPDICRQIQSFGEYLIMVERILIDDSLENCEKELLAGRDDIERVKELLFDQRSRKIYTEVIRRRTLYGECDFSDLMARGEWEYQIPLMFRRNRPEDEVILDCGAAVGDTLRQFAKTFGPKLKRVYAFECGKNALMELEKEAASLKCRKWVPDVRIMPYGLSDHEGEMVFARTLRPNASFIRESRLYAEGALDVVGYDQVKVSTIDKLIPIEEKVTLIKMDIEGSEYNALLGARKTIQTHKPKLAISLYHNGKDYYRLPLLAKELVPEYKIAVRHHNKNHCDTDMYCWVD